MHSFLNTEETVHETSQYHYHRQEIEFSNNRGIQYQSTFICFYDLMMLKTEEITHVFFSPANEVKLYWSYPTIKS